jgi:hypothetical protein
MSKAVSKDYKKNHFVPRSYLKYWSFDNSKRIFQQNIKSGKVYSNQIKDVCQKSNLYDTSLESNPKVLEKEINSLSEDFIPDFGSYLKTGMMDPAKIGRLKTFIIHQSFRTPKFYDENYNQIGLEPSSNWKKGDIFGAFYLTNYDRYIENSVLQLYEVNGVNNFITSDNPSSHWIRVNGGWTYVDKVIKNNSLNGNMDYNIICPVTPKHIAILSPNIGIPTTAINKGTIETFNVNPSGIPKFNAMLKYAADKVIFGKRNEDFLF